MTGIVTIESLPNEILIAVLSCFTTTALLPFASISHRFYDIIVRIIHTRLLNASVLEGHQLILECSHPSAKAFTPCFFAVNLGTGTGDHVATEPHILSNGEGTDKLGKLKDLYSHFRPLLPDEVHRSRRRRAGSWALDTSNSLSEIQTEYVCQNVHLEPHELFSQLCIVSNIVKEGLEPGTYLSCVTIGGGVIRVWRDWLTVRYGSTKCDRLSSGLNAKQRNDTESRKGLLWADSRENVGLRILVTERQDSQAPVLADPGEEISVAYMLQYEELVIRTTQLLLALERSNSRELEASVKGLQVSPWN